MNRFLLLVFVLSVFVACKNQTNLSSSSVENPKIEYSKVGDSIANLAQKVLMSNLMSAMEKGGSVNAVQFCNVKAIPLTDSVAQSLKVHIQRISLKNRNDNNVPDGSIETDLLSFYDTQKQNGIELRDTVINHNQKTIYYKPIAIVMPTCLKCHGEPNVDIDKATLAVLDEKYPNDKAKNYKIGEFRGAWKITF